MAQNFVQISPDTVIGTLHS